MNTPRARAFRLLPLVALAAMTALATALPVAQAADDDKLPYQLPPKELVDLIDAQPTPFVSVGPDNQTMLLMGRPNLPPLSELAEPELRLAGLRIKPRTNGPSRNRWAINQLTFKRMGDLVETPVEGLPPGAQISYVSWSPDGSMIAFAVTDDRNIELWTAEANSGKSKRVLRQRLNAARGRPFHWLSDSRTLVCAIVPEDRGAEPEASRIPAGPVVQENIGTEAPARTYQDLLKNAHDEALFDHYFTAQLMRVEVKGKRKRLGQPAVVTAFRPSPDGKYLMVQTLHKPYSYLVPHYRFPRKVEVWDMDGNVVREVADLPLMEGVPTAFGSVPTGPRSFEWRSDAPATLAWVEAQDGGDARAEAEIRDRVFTLAAPFRGQGKPLLDLGQRYGGMIWGTDEVALAVSWWWKTRNVKTWRVRPVDASQKPTLISDVSWEDRYNDPGEFVTRRNRRGFEVLHTGPNHQSLFLSGEGASPEGNRPFLDRLSLADNSTTRLWQSQDPYYEEIVKILDREGKQIVTRREAREEQPNYYVRTLGDAGAEPRQLTDIPHPHPELTGLYKELVHYERADGVKLNGTLYLPPGKVPGDGPFPLLLWAYPQEFKSADAAGQVDDSPHRFNRVSGHSAIAWVTQGYAVLDDPTLPIVGEGDKEPNDTYVEQLVAGAEAAAKELVRRGVADPDRIAIAGHSYGAFMTANLLAHSDIFRAGIARSGAYNRTLTPFGFQAEERTVWEAPEIYFRMSPFMHADKVDEPILLIHGEADNNPGTFPMQSERFYNALKGLGGTARLVMLPHESHGYRARESVLHMLWESHRWLDEYVKNAGPREGSGDTSSAN